MKSTVTYFFLTMFAFHSMNSQTVSVGLGSGIDMIQGNNFYTEDFGRIGLYHQKNGTETNFAGLGLKNNIEISLNTKIGWTKIPVIFIAQIHYLSFRGNEKVEMFDINPALNHYENVAAINDIWSYRLGVRYNIQIDKFYPFCSASVLINEWNDSKLRFDYQEHITVMPQYRNGVRYGYNAGMGLGYTVNDNIELEMEANYNFMNEGNRRNGEVKMNTVNILFVAYYTLLH